MVVMSMGMCMLVFMRMLTGGMICVNIKRDCGDSLFVCFADVNFKLLQRYGVKLIEQKFPVNAQVYQSSGCHIAADTGITFKI